MCSLVDDTDPSQEVSDDRPESSDVSSEFKFQIQIPSSSGSYSHTNNEGNGEDENVKDEKVKGVSEVEQPPNESDMLSIKNEESQLYICKDKRFCKVLSQTSKVKDKEIIRHYVMKEDEHTDIEGDTGLEPMNELLEVNGKTLTNKTQTYVERIFKEIGPTGQNKRVDVNLRILKWVASEGPVKKKPWVEVKTILISLVLEFKRGPMETTLENAPLGEVDKKTLVNPAMMYADNHPDMQTKAFRRNDSSAKAEQRQLVVVGEPITEETKCSKLNKGNIDDIKDGENHVCCRYKVPGTAVYISGDPLEGNVVGLSVISDDNSGWLNEQSFSGMNQEPEPVFSYYIFCLRFFIQDTNDKLFISSNIRSSDKVTFVSDTNDISKIQNNIDERCFIRHVRPDGRELYQSLIYRDWFIAYHLDTHRLYMMHVSLSVQEAYVTGIKTKKEISEANSVFSNCWFDRFQERRVVELRQRRWIRRNFAKPIACFAIVGTTVFRSVAWLLTLWRRTMGWIWEGYLL